MYPQKALKNKMYPEKALKNKMYTVVILFVLTLSSIQCSSLHRERRDLIKSSADTVKKIDLEARRELLFLIVGKINDTVNAQTLSIKDCEGRINGTVESCTACQTDLCTPTVPFHKAVLGTISTGLNYPVVYAGKGIETIGKWFGTSTAWMGTRAGEFAKSVGSVANTVGNSLENSGNTAINFLGNTFSSLGNKLESTGDSIINALEKSVDGVMGLDVPIQKIGSVLGNVWKDIESGFTSVISDAGKGISKAATTVWDNTFGKLFRKRRSAYTNRQKRCVSSCPMCEDLNTEVYTIDQISEKICGAKSVSDKNKAVSDVTFLQELYNSTIAAEIITEIHFETNSIDFSGGSAAFKISHYLINGTTFQFGGLFDASKHEDTGKAIAQEYFTKLTAKL